MPDETTTNTSATARIQRLLQGADEDTQEVIRHTLAIESAKLYQAGRNKSGIARDIADDIRRAIQ